MKSFLSYPSEQRSIARALYDFLLSIGVRPWFDQEDLVAGQEWERSFPLTWQTLLSSSPYGDGAKERSGGGSVHDLFGRSRLCDACSLCIVSGPRPQTDRLTNPSRFQLARAKQFHFTSSLPQFARRFEGAIRLGCLRKETAIAGDYRWPGHTPWIFMLGLACASDARCSA
jgi:hypothetical protein